MNIFKIFSAENFDFFLLYFNLLERLNVIDYYKNNAKLFQYEINFSRFCVSST